MSERQRYCLDIARELYYLKAIDALYTRDAADDYPALENVARRTVVGTGSVTSGYTIEDTVQYWKLASQIKRFVDNYGSGFYGKARTDLEVRPVNFNRF